MNYVEDLKLPVFPSIWMLAYSNKQSYSILKQYTKATWSPCYRSWKIAKLFFEQHGWNRKVKIRFFERQPKRHYWRFMQATSRLIFYSPPFYHFDINYVIKLDISKYGQISHVYLFHRHIFNNLISLVYLKEICDHILLNTEIFCYDWLKTPQIELLIPNHFLLSLANLIVFNNSMIWKYFKRVMSLL